MVAADAAIATSGGKVQFHLVFLPITANGELDCWSSSGESGEPRTELRVQFSRRFHSHSLVFKLRTECKIIIKTCKDFFVEYIKLNFNFSLLLFLEALNKSINMPGSLHPR